MSRVSNTRTRLKDAASLFYMQSLTAFFSFISNGLFAFFLRSSRLFHNFIRLFFSVYAFFLYLRYFFFAWLLLQRVLHIHKHTFLHIYNVVYFFHNLKFKCRRFSYSFDCSLLLTVASAWNWRKQFNRRKPLQWCYATTHCRYILWLSALYLCVCVCARRAKFKLQITSVRCVCNCSLVFAVQRQ